MRILYAITLVICCQVYAFSQNLSKKQLQKDAKALETILLKVHPSPTAYISKDSIRQIIYHLTSDITDSLDIVSWETRVRHALLPIGCGHTYMAKGRVTKSKKFMLPIQVFCSGDRIWLERMTDSTQLDAIPPGAEILKIGTHSAAEILNTLKKHQPSDGYNRTFQERFMNRGPFFNFLFMKYFDRDSIQHITWSGNDGVQHQQSIHCTSKYSMETPAPKPDSSITIVHSAKNNEQYFYYYPQNKDIGVLKITTFGTKKATKMYQKAITDLNKNKTPYLVIDMRDNTGGKFNSSVNLIRYLSNERIEMRLHRRLFRSWKYQPSRNHLKRIAKFWVGDLFSLQPRWIKNGRMYYKVKYKPSRKYHYNGQVFVLVNGMSFSASSQTATFLKEHTSSVVIGTETGGGSKTINGMQIPIFRLPESKFLINVPMYHLNFKLGPDTGAGVTPHIRTQYAIEDILAKRDLDWEVVLQWIAAHKG